MKSSVRMFVPVACAVVLFACRDRQQATERGEMGREAEPGGGTMAGQQGAERQGAGQATITGANVVSNQAAIDRIVAARCQRAAACNDIGADREYASRDVCMREIRTSMRDDLKASECPGGIDAKELNECLTEIRNENCNNPLDTIGRLAACRTSDLCQSTAIGNP